MLSIQRPQPFNLRDRLEHALRRRGRCFASLVGLVVSVLFLALLLILFPLPRYTAVPAHASGWSRSTFTMKAPKSGTTAVAQTVPIRTPTPLATPAGQTINASRALVRINQLDASQYSSAHDATTWAMSACSAAALTEVINAWGNFHYTIAVILKVESAVGAITPALGLTTEAGIATTAATFGFQTDWGHHKSLDQIIAAANRGTPVIVAFPPQTYDGGHIVVVTGGNATTVSLADSSRYNRTSLSRAQFSAWWRGFSAILTPTPFTIMGPPTISATYINQVLSRSHSPATGLGQTIINLGKQYGIDPVFLLAIFQHESGYGTAGEARYTYSPGNERCIQERPCINNQTPPGPCQTGQSCYAQMHSWADGFDRLNYLLLNGYVRGQITGTSMVDIDEIIPAFAPRDDNNDTTEYIAVLKQDVTTMRRQSQAV